MKNSKRFLTCALAIVLLMAMLPVAVFAAVDSYWTSSYPNALFGVNWYSPFNLSYMGGSGLTVNDNQSIPVKFQLPDAVGTISAYAFLYSDRYDFSDGEQNAVKKQWLNLTNQGNNTYTASFSLSGTNIKPGAYYLCVEIYDSGYGKDSATQIAIINVKSSQTIQTVAATGVKLNKASLNLNVGQTSTLTATVSPSNATDKRVTWTSDKKSVATVTSSGTVKGVKAGTATITARTANGMTAQCTVTVKAVPVKSVKLKSTLTLKEGQTVTLKATISPSNATDKKLKWSTSNKSFATVTSGGTVKGVKAGKAIITVRTSNGMTATCAVTVKAATLEEKLKNATAFAWVTYVNNNRAYIALRNNHSTKYISSVTMHTIPYGKNGKAIKLSSGGGPYTLSASLYPGDADGSYYFDVWGATMAKARTCVKSVGFSDGTSWKNPYYNEWLKKYKSKY